MRVAFCTLGCKVNHYETQAMQELFVQAGYQVVPFSEQADIYVVNTCTVTQVSDKKSRQMLHRAHERNKDALIAAVGCYAETSAATLAALPGIGVVIGTDGRKDIVSRCERALLHADTGVSNAAHAPQSRCFEELSAVHDGRTRADLKIQDGCSSFCAYCIIPYARGPVRSRPLESCKRELALLAASGFREVVLTGIQLSSYGKDLQDGSDLSSVIRLANAAQGIDRIRLGSLEPLSVTDRFLETVRDCDSLCGQFHLSLQSGSDAVLRRMNRRYTTGEYRDAVNRLRQVRPDCAITTDLIAGFVAETEQEHAETVAFVRKISFARIHVFPYSRRAGTRAAELPGHLSRQVKDRRAAELIALGNGLEQAFVDAQIGKCVRVLMESDGTGYTDNYVRVRCPGDEGELVSVRLTGRDGVLAVGTPV